MHAKFLTHICLPQTSAEVMCIFNKRNTSSLALRFPHMVNYDWGERGREREREKHMHTSNHSDKVFINRKRTNKDIVVNTPKTYFVPGTVTGQAKQTVQKGC